MATTATDTTSTDGTAPKSGAADGNGTAVGNGIADGNGPALKDRTANGGSDLGEGVPPRVLGDEELERFWREGYLLLPGVLSPFEAEHYRQAAIDVFPRDLSVPPHWHAWMGRFKPYSVTGDDCWDTPELLPLFANETLYAVMAQLLGSSCLRVFDGSLGFTFRNDASPESARSQNLHLDASVPPELDQFLLTPEEVQLGGCFYLSDVGAGGGGIHVVPGGHLLVEQEARGHSQGRHLHQNWRDLEHLESIEVTGRAGDFALLHHLMPHAASHNRLPTTRVAQFLRFVRVDHPHGYGSRPPRPYNEAQLAAMTPLARRLHGLDPWS